MKKVLITFATIVAAFSLASCKKESVVEPDEPQNGGKELCEVIMNISGTPVTKAAGDGDQATQNAEDYLSSVEVFVFDARPSSIAFKMLESYKSATASEIDGTNHNKATIRFNTSTGLKHIYVIANSANNYNAGGQPLANTISTEDQFLAAITQFNENSVATGKCDFMMAGTDASLTAASATSSGTNLVQGANNINIQLKRLVARVKLEKVASALTSPALAAADFKVTNVYLLNVPKRTILVNGDWRDVFGRALVDSPAVPNAIDAASAAAASGAAPGFVPSASVPYYYSYAVPAASSTADDGYWNRFANPAAWNDNTNTSANFKPADAAVLGMTWFEAPAGEGVLTNRADYTFDKYFYTYPNSAAAQRSDQNTLDETTKLVIETSINMNGTPHTYYYPISIPYVQPNYAYTVENVTITRLGSTNPFLPVTTADCTYNVVVRNWDTGAITGSFNNETSDEGNFSI